MARYFGSVTVRLHVPIDLHGAEPTLANLINCAHSQVQHATSSFVERFGGVSYGAIQVSEISIELEQRAKEPSE